MHVLPSVTVQCTRDGQFVVVVAQDATDPRTDVNSISLLKSDGPSCTPVDFTDVFAIFQFPVTACGTTMKEVGGLQRSWFAKKKTKNFFCCIKCLMKHTNASILQEESYIVYENHMSSSYEVGIGPRGSITRDSHFE